MTRVMPKDHRCDVGDIDYTDLIDGKLRCTVCRRRWDLVTNRGPAKWWPDPCQCHNRDPADCFNYGRKPKKKSYL